MREIELVDRKPAMLDEVFLAKRASDRLRRLPDLQRAIAALGIGVVTVSRSKRRELRIESVATRNFI